MKNQRQKNKISSHLNKGHKPILDWSISKIDLLGKTEYKFDKAAKSNELIQLAKLLRIQNLLSFKFKGSIFHECQKGTKFRLIATLSATTVQNCVITLQPIRKKNTIVIERWFFNKNNRQNPINTLLNHSEDEIDTFYDEISLYDIALEELVLNLPDYPRKPNAKFKGISVTEKGITELKDNPLRPFAALSVLKKEKSTN